MWMPVWWLHGFDVPQVLHDVCNERIEYLQVDLLGSHWGATNMSLKRNLQVIWTYYTRPYVLPSFVFDTPWNSKCSKIAFMSFWISWGTTTHTTHTEAHLPQTRRFSLEPQTPHLSMIKGGTNILLPNGGFLSSRTPEIQSAGFSSGIGIPASLKIRSSFRTHSIWVQKREWFHLLE
jgi:hypothetical protein